MKGGRPGRRRKETYRNKFPVPAGRTLSERRRYSEKRKTRKWTGAQESYYTYSGETTQTRERVVKTAVLGMTKQTC